MIVAVLLSADDDVPADFVSALCEGGCGWSGWVAPQSAEMATVTKLCQWCLWLKLQIDD